MDLKEYIKQLAREMLGEQEGGAIGNTTAAVSGYLSKNFINPGGKNKATKQAEEEGWTVTKGETTVPGDSKVKDYEPIWRSAKKKKVKIYQESNYDKASPSSNQSPSDRPSLYLKKSEYTSENMNESLINIIKEELLNEVTYHKFKNEVKFRTKNEQLHKAIREVKRKLQEIDRIVEYTSRMKQELSEGEEGLRYWKKTESNIATISEMVNHLNNKIKNLH
jgi:hypothetical protein